MKFDVSDRFKTAALHTAITLAGGIISGGIVNPAISATLKVPGNYSTIQDAVDAAAPNDTVLVADGTYTGIGNVNIDLHGKPIILRSVDGPGKTIINCQGGSGKPGVRAFFFNTVSPKAAVIDGFTIENGYEGSNGGGGILILSSSPTIEHCVFKDHALNGGGICVESGQPQILNCTFTCSAASGAAIDANGFTSTISGCEFIGCIVTTSNAGTPDGMASVNLTDSTVSMSADTFHGNPEGGISLTDSAVTLNNSSFDNNGAVNNLALTDAITANISSVSVTNTKFNANVGGAIYSFAGPMTAEGCSFTSNSMHAISANGGQAMVSHCRFNLNTSCAVTAGGGESVDLSDCSFTNNRASNKEPGAVDAENQSAVYLTGCNFTSNSGQGGLPGGVYAEQSWLMAKNSTFYQNQGGAIALQYLSNSVILGCNISGNNTGSKNIDGGGIQVNDSGLLIENSTLTNDTGGVGGGIALTNATGCTIRNCNLEGNLASAGSGGAVSVASCNQVAITNTILYDDLSYSGATEISSDNQSNVAVTFSDVDNGYFGQGNIDANPDWETGYRLNQMSPCYKHGTSFAAPTCAEDGEARPDPPSIGAYEVTVAGPVGPTIEAFEPAGGKPGSFVTLLGSNFSHATSVTFGDVSAKTFTVASPNSLRVTVPSGAMTSRIEVTTPTGKFITSSYFVVTTSGKVLSVPDQYPTIQAAVDAAHSGDAIVVGDGDYSGPGNVAIDFKGKPVTLTSLNGPDRTAIDCQFGSDCIRLHSGETQAALINGFTIVNALQGVVMSAANSTIHNCDFFIPNGLEVSSESGTFRVAGCIFDTEGTDDDSIAAYTSSATIEGCAFINCSGSSAGISASNSNIAIDTSVFAGCTEAVNIDSGNLTLSDCTLIGNGTNDYEGAILLGNSTAFAENDRFVDNLAPRGAAAYISESTFTASACTFNSNTDFSGGALFIYGGSANLSGCTFMHNGVGPTSEQEFSGAGAIEAERSSSLTIEDCSFLSNTGTAGFPGSVDADGSTSIISASLFAGNIGGAIAENGGKLAITNCTLFNNVTSGSGGGISLNAAEGSSITNCTFTRNTAVESGGAIDVTNTSMLSVTNDILYGDSAANGREIALGGESSAQVSYTDIAGGYFGATNLNVDPLWVYPIGSQPDFHLQLVSPCHGTGTAVDAPLTTEDGYPRPDPPSMGAYEIEPDDRVVTPA